MTALRIPSAWTERNRDGSWSAYLDGFEVAAECECEADAAYRLEIAILRMDDCECEADYE